MGAIIPAAEKLLSIKKYLTARADALSMVIPAMYAKKITPTRMIMIVLANVQRNPQLLDCRLDTLYRAIHNAAQLGLEPGSPLGQYYIVPFKDEVVGIIGYKGWIALARRGGEVASIEGHAVYERDEFQFEYGLNQKLRHVPALTDRGKLIATYAIARLVGANDPQFDVMSLFEIENVKARSRAAGKGFSPWQTDYDRMAIKSVIRRICNQLPMNQPPEEADAIELSERMERGDVIDIDPTAVVVKDSEAINSAIEQTTPEAKPDEVVEIKPATLDEVINLERRDPDSKAVAEAVSAASVPLDELCRIIHEVHGGAKTMADVPLKSRAVVKSRVNQWIEARDAKKVLDANPFGDNR